MTQGIRIHSEFLAQGTTGLPIKKSARTFLSSLHPPIARDSIWADLRFEGVSEKKTICEQREKRYRSNQKATLETNTDTVPKHMIARRATHGHGGREGGQLIHEALPTPNHCDFCLIVDLDSRGSRINQSERPRRRRRKKLLVGKDGLCTGPAGEISVLNY